MRYGDAGDDASLLKTECTPRTLPLEDVVAAVLRVGLEYLGDSAPPFRRMDGDST